MRWSLTNMLRLNVCLRWVRYSMLRLSEFMIQVKNAVNVIASGKIKAKIHAPP